ATDAPAPTPTPPPGADRRRRPARPRRAPPAAPGRRGPPCLAATPAPPVSRRGGGGCAGVGARPAGRAEASPGGPPVRPRAAGTPARDPIPNACSKHSHGAAALSSARPARRRDTTQGYRPAMAALIDAA